MITHDARWSHSCGNNPVLSPWLVTKKCLYLEPRYGIEP